ncbi:MAG: PAS domain S-box protein, partial [Vicinamibacterales bacterium]
MRHALDDAAIGMSVASLNWRLLRVNQAHVELLGYSENELLTTDFRTRIHPDDLAPNDTLRADLFAGRINSYETVRRYIHREGRIVHCLVTVSLIRDPDGKPQYFVGQMQDISERIRAEEALRQSEQRMARILASASDGMIIIDPASTVTLMNPAAERITGLPATALLGRSIRDFPWPIHQHDGQPLPPGSFPIDQVLASGTAVHGIEVSFTPDDCSTVFGVVDVAPLIDGDNQVDGLLLTIHDVTERMMMERQLAQLALHDALTGLPNRRLFEDRAGQALTAARRGGWQVAVLLVDLDNFKPVNDRFGHSAGDGVLIEVARRLEGCVRDEDTVARLGGDEFVVLLRCVHASGDLDCVEQRVIAALAAPHLVTGEEVFVKA